MLRPLSRSTCVLACGVMLAAPASVVAQATQDQSSSSHVGIELSGALAGTQPEATVVACCQVHQRPGFVGTDTTFTALSVGPTLRLYWNDRVHTGIEYAWTVRGGYEVTYPTPAEPPPPFMGFLPSAVIGHTTERTGWTLSIAQCVDLVTRGRWRPWLGGELVIDRIVEHYDQTSLVYDDPVYTSVYSEEREDTAVAGAFAAGLKVFVTDRAFISGDVSLRKYFTEESLTRATARWRVGAGVRLRSPFEPAPARTPRQAGGPTAPAEPRRGSFYLHGGIAFPWRPGVTGEESVTYVSEPGGRTLGWVAGGGAFLYHFMSLEGELSRTGMTKAVEPSRYFMTFIEERRDLFIVAGTRFHLPLSSAFRLEPVVGFAVVVREAWSQVDRMTYLAPDDWGLKPGVRERQQLPPGVGLAAGADLRIGSRRVALLPSFRVFRMTVSGGVRDAYPGGASGWTIRPALELRIELPGSQP